MTTSLITSPFAPTEKAPTEKAPCETRCARDDSRVADVIPALYLCTTFNDHASLIRDDILARTHSADGLVVSCNTPRARRLLRAFTAGRSKGASTFLPVSNMNLNIDLNLLLRPHTSNSSSKITWAHDDVMAFQPIHGRLKLTATRRYTSCSKDATRAHLLKLKPLPSGWNFDAGHEATFTCPT